MVRVPCASYYCNRGRTPAVRPRFAVISVGAHNPFDYPRQEVLARLEGSNVATFRTDAHGAVTFYLDGRGVEPRLPGR